MSDRMFDRKNYPAKTIENFEIISSYYVDIFYNHLYAEAKKYKAHGTVASITEGFKHTLNAFLRSLDNPKLYKKSIVGLHHYYISIGFGSISFAKCIDKLTHEFVPTDYYESLTSTQKMGVLRMVINQVIKDFIRKIVDEHMSKIIDFHTEAENVRILQDEFINILIIAREGMYQRFVAVQTHTNKDETVNRLLGEKMQGEIKKLIKEKYEYQRQIILYKKALKKRKEMEANQIAIIKSLNNTISELNGQLSQTSVYVAPTTDVIPSISEDTSILTYEKDNPKLKVSQLQVQTIHSPSAFIEVNSNNINDLLSNKTEDLQQLTTDDEDDNVEMDSGTSLNDYF
jgi:hypothetical protein